MSGRGRPLRGRCAIALLPLALAAACQGSPGSTVERLTVADSVEAQRLESAGVPPEAVARAAAQLFDAAPGFVPVRKARGRTRRFRGRVHLQRVEALSTDASSDAVAHVVLTVELEPLDGEPARRESGRAAEPIGSGPDALRGALERATTAALQRAVRAFSMQLAAERKRSGELIEDLASPEARVRDHAVRALAERGDPGAVPALVPLLRDPDPEVVERTVGALAQLRDPRAVPALIELAHHRDGPYVANLAHVVGDIGGPSARAWLLTMASGHPDEGVRTAAREALAEMAAHVPAASAGAEGGR